MHCRCLGLSCEGVVALWGWVAWAEFYKQETPTCLSTDERDPVQKGMMQSQGRAA